MPQDSDATGLLHVTCPFPFSLAEFSMRRSRSWLCWAVLELVVPVLPGWEEAEPWHPDTLDGSQQS